MSDWLEELCDELLCELRLLSDEDDDEDDVGGFHPTTKSPFTLQNETPVCSVVHELGDDDVTWDEDSDDSLEGDDSDEREDAEDDDEEWSRACHSLLSQFSSQSGKPLFAAVIDTTCRSVASSRAPATAPADGS